MKSLFAALFLVILFSCKESGVDLGKPSTFVRYINGGTPDQSQAIIPTSDNGFIILANSGATLTSTYSLIKVVKVDAYGNQVWQSLIPGAPPSDPTQNPAKNYRGFGITAISDNSGTDTGYLIVGDEINNGTQGLLMIQIEPTEGKVVTTVTKTSADIGMQVRGVAVTPSKTAGNFYVLGQAIVTSGPDMFLAEVNSSFTPLWTRTYGDASTTLVNKVFAFGDSIYWGGTRTASSSLMRWDKSFVNSGAVSNTNYPTGGTTASYSCNDICKFGFGYGFVGSYSEAAGEYKKIAFFRIDANGNVADAANFDTPFAQSFPAGNSITATNDGGFLILGTVATDEQDSDANYYLIKTDAHGAEQWKKTYGGKFLDIGCKVLQAKDGGYIVLGTTTLANVQSIFLMKTDSQGEIQ